MQLGSGQIARTTSERVAQGSSTVLALGPLVYLAYVWTDLPARVPVHYNLSGQADGFADARTFWLVPLLGLVMFVGLSLLERVPHVYNYPFPITHGNREAAYRLGRQTVLGVKTYMAALFAYITIATVHVSLGHIQGLGAWFVPVVLLLLTIGVTISWRGFTRLRQRA